MEAVVFNQDELAAALEAGCKSICLCDGAFVIGAEYGVSFLAIGDARVGVLASRPECEELNMRFLNFEPEYAKDNRAFVPLKYSGLSNNGSYASGSYSSSYRLANSYRLAGSYRMMTSFASSYRLASSYRYASSFAVSYRYSFAGSFLSSFGTSLRPSAAAGAKEHDVLIPVFGYGIDLI